MQRTKDGFLLISWMVQCSLLILISLISYSLIMNWYKSIGRAQALFADILPVYLSCDQLIYDMHCASSVIADNNDFVILHDSKRIRWYCKETRLMRSASGVNMKEGIWEKPSVSLMSKKIKRCEMRSLSLEGVDGYTIDVTLEHVNELVKQLMIMRKGLVL